MIGELYFIVHVAQNKKTGLRGGVPANIISLPGPYLRHLPPQIQRTTPRTTQQPPGIHTRRCRTPPASRALHPRIWKAQPKHLP